MVTPDKDYGQLVGENRKLYKQKGDSIEVIDAAAICEKYGIPDPVLVRDILAIWGDASDNIPGVPGIGEKGPASSCSSGVRWRICWTTSRKSRGGRAPASQPGATNCASPSGSRPSVWMSPSISGPRS